MREFKCFSKSILDKPKKSTKNKFITVTLTTAVESWIRLAVLLSVGGINGKSNNKVFDKLPKSI